jgi:hypothetical protein
MEENGALQTNDAKRLNDLVLGRMDGGPGRINNFAGIKPKRRRRRLREQFGSQAGYNDGKRGESPYLFTSFSSDVGGKKLQHLKTLIVRSLINLIDASR